MSVKINTPNTMFEGVRGGIEFKKGEAIVEDEKHGEAIANEFGYMVEKVKDAPKKQAPKKQSKKTEPKKEDESKE